MRLPITAVRVISPLALAILASTALAGELIDAQMDQITAGGLFELTADELDILTSAPVGPLQRNVIGGVGGLLEEFLSGMFRSQHSLLRDLAWGELPNANTTPSTPNLGTSPITGSALGTSPITGSALGTSPITGSALGTSPITGSALGTSPITGSALGTSPITGSALGTSPITGSALGTSPITGSALGTSPITGSALGTSPITGSALGTSPITGSALGTSPITGSALGTSPT